MIIPHGASTFHGCRGKRLRGTDNRRIQRYAFLQHRHQFKLFPQVQVVVACYAVGAQRNMEYGFRTTQQGTARSAAQYVDENNEGVMLTNDNSIVSIEAIYQYTIRDVKQYHYDVDDPTGTLQLAFEAVIRRNIQNRPLDDALLNKEEIELQVLPDFQALIDTYDMHEARQYQVEKLDFDTCKAFIRAVDVDYYTDADLNVSLSVLDELKEKSLNNGVQITLGELKITSIVKIFKKMKLDTHENLGFGPVRLPETDMHTVGMWWTVPKTMTTGFTNDDLQGALLGVTNLMITVDEPSPLRSVFGEGLIGVNSFHHQAIKALAPALTVCARAADGVIEAVYDANKPFVLGVQWHPERMREGAPLFHGPYGNRADLPALWPCAGL